MTFRSLAYFGTKKFTLGASSIRIVTLLEAHAERIACAVQYLYGLIKGKAPIASSDSLDRHDSINGKDTDEHI